MAGLTGVPGWAREFLFMEYIQLLDGMAWSQYIDDVIHELMVMIIGIIVCCKLQYRILKFNDDRVVSICGKYMTVCIGVSSQIGGVK